MKALAWLALLFAVSAHAATVPVQWCASVPAGNTVSPTCVTVTVTVPDIVCPVCPIAPPVVLPPPVLPAESAVLLWDAVVGATGYRVYYGAVASRIYDQPIGSGLLTTLTTFTVAGLAPLGQYYFAVTALNDRGESAFSNEVSKTIGFPPDTQPPTVPTGLTAKAISATQISLTWSASKDNIAVTGYLVYNADTGSVIATRVGTSFTHSGLKPGSTHNYRVSAFDAVPNHSPWTDPPVSATTPLQ